MKSSLMDLAKTGFSFVAGTAAILMALNSCGKPNEDEIVDPSGNSRPGGAVRGEANFAHLINNYATGRPRHSPWAGYWWPYKSGGISAGSTSSPAGKYDAARGRRTNAQGWEARHHGPGPKVEGWWGHCNGWSAAAALFIEPRESRTVNGIRFSPGEIKAILTEGSMENNSEFWGNRIEPWDEHISTERTKKAYYDVSADQFFLILTNYMGKDKQAVLIDRYTTGQVWNQPLVGYRFKYPKPSDVLPPDSSAPNVHRIKLTVQIFWASDEVDRETLTDPFEWEDSVHYDSRELGMEIWMDAPVVFGADGKVASSGNVIVTRSGDFHVGGAWTDAPNYCTNCWPDYVWVPFSVVKPDPNATPEPYGNPHIDIDWVKTYLLPGRDDPTSPTDTPIDPPPSHTPVPTGTGTFTPIPTGTATPIPTGTTSPRPTPTRT